MMKKLRTQMRWIMLVIVVVFLFSTFLMYGGRGTRRSSKHAPDGSMMDYEVAEVNGRSFMRSELERRARGYLETYGQHGMTSPDMPAIYQTVLDQYVLEQELAREVRDRGITVSDAEAEQAMKAYADQVFPTREAFFQYLDRSGIKVDDYKKDMARQMAVERLLRSAIGNVVVSEDQAVNFYDTMKNVIYRKPEGYKVSLASFRTRSEAEALRKRLIGGKDWAHATSEDVVVSQDVLSVTQEPIFLPDSAFDAGTLLPMKSLDVGQVSPVFELASSDFAVGLKTEKVPASVLSYNEVSSDIRTLLRQQEERQNLKDFEQELLSKAKIVVHDASLFPQKTSQDMSSKPVSVESPASSSDKKAEAPVSEDAAVSGDTGK